MNSDFEHVLRVDDWYDGVREGVVVFRGVPHHFVWLGWELESWNPEEDRYRLTPLLPMHGQSVIMRAIFRNSATAPDPHCPPLVPQEVCWVL
jgi:hypothetical protein